MQTYLPFNVGQCSHGGVRKEQHDWFDFKIPQGDELFQKGCGFAFACDVDHATNGRESAQTVVRSFLLDYFSTPNNWGVEESMQRVVRAINGWLNAQKQYSKNEDDTMLCKFAGLVFLNQRAFVINVGGVPMYLFRDNKINTECFDSNMARPLGSSFVCISEVFIQEIEKGDVLAMTNAALASKLSPLAFLELIQKRDEDLNHTACAMVNMAEKLGKHSGLSAALIEVL